MMSLKPSKGKDPVLETGSFSSQTSLTTPINLSSPLASPSPSTIVNPMTSRDYDLIPEGQEHSNEPTSSWTSRTPGRPRKYNSMRQRRIEANAKKRARKRTMKDAFESLRRAIPACTQNQKLSTLAILRIASAYILALTCSIQQDYTQEQNRQSLVEWAEQCTRAIQAEDRSRRNTTKESDKRSKRKSYEPKKIKDVLLLNTFSSNSDEDETEDDEVDDVLETIERDRPSSAVGETRPVSSEAPLRTPTDLSSSLASPSPSTIVNPMTSRDYDLIPEGQEDSNETTSSLTSRTPGRPRKYNSMRQRRIEASSKERTRIRTMKDAFESLRRAIPACTQNQKLSRLAILRMASAYILALTCSNQQDYIQEQNRQSLAEWAEQCTRAIQAEDRSRRNTTKDADDEARTLSK